MHAVQTFLGSEASSRTNMPLRMLALAVTRNTKRQPATMKECLSPTLVAKKPPAVAPANHTLRMPTTSLPVLLKLRQASFLAFETQCVFLYRRLLWPCTAYNADWQCDSPKLDARKRKPKTLPLCAEQYRSASSDSTHGMMSAKPNPFHALRHIACIAKRHEELLPHHGLMNSLRATMAEGNTSVVQPAHI